MKTNAYNFSNDLARIGNSLSRAMIGNASDDAAIALAKYRDAQTEGQNLSNRAMSGNLDAMDAASKGNIMQNSIANALGYDVNNGNLIQPVLPDGAQMSVPALGADQVNMDGGALMTELSNIARTMYGDGTSNANQLSQMLNNLGAAGSSRMAESMILGGTNDQAGRGALLMSPSGGKYQNPGFAGQELATNDATNRRDDDLNFESRMDKNKRDENVGMDKNRRVENVGMDKNTKDMAAAGDLTAAKERWNNHKTDVQAGVDRDKNKAADATVRYKHDTRTVEFTVEPGKLLVIDPVSAKKAKIPIQTEGEYKGLYVLDGGEKPGNVKVTVGKGDVYMDQATADALGIKPNANGQYVIKGAGFETDASTRGKSGSSASGTALTIAPSDDKALREFIVSQDSDNKIKDMANAATIMNQLVIQSVSAMGSKKNISNAKSFITQKLSRGFAEFEIPNSGMISNDKFNVPTYLIDEINGTTGNVENDKAIKELKTQTPDRWLDAATAILDQHGFSELQIKTILG